MMTADYSELLAVDANSKKAETHPDCISISLYQSKFPDNEGKDIVAKKKAKWQQNGSR